MDEDEVTAQKIKLAIILIQVTVLGYLMVPADTRKRLVMRLAAVSRRLLDGAARRSGRACMATELATGRQEYTAPLAMSLARDRMAAVYERMRSS
jgi:hypothetical protein